MLLLVVTAAAVVATAVVVAVEKHFLEAVLPALAEFPTMMGFPDRQWHWRSYYFYLC